MEKQAQAGKVQVRRGYVDPEVTAQTPPEADRPESDPLGAPTNGKAGSAGVSDRGADGKEPGSQPDEDEGEIQLQERLGVEGDQDCEAWNHHLATRWALGPAKLEATVDYEKFGDEARASKRPSTRPARLLTHRLEYQRTGGSQPQEAYMEQAGEGKAVAAVVRRIHQNLGHPPTRELVKHLRLSGASSAMVQAAQQLTCRTCDKSTKAKPAKVAAPVTCLDFNEAVAIDVIWLGSADTEGATLPALNVVDFASTYQQVIPMEAAARAFTQGWISWAGTPKHVTADLDSAFKGRFLAEMDARGIALRCVHWQNGVVERHGAAWKQIYQKVVLDRAALLEEVPDTVLWPRSTRRRTPFATVPGSLHDNGSSEAMGFTMMMMMAPRTLTWRLRTPSSPGSKSYGGGPQSSSPADPLRAGSTGLLRVYYYRLARPGKGKKPQPIWLGPATVIGREGSNYWLARGGRCILAAPEHVRSAHHEEVSEMLRTKMALAQVQKLLRECDEMEVEETEQPKTEPSEEVAMEAEDELAREGELESARRRRALLDDAPHVIKKARMGEAGDSTAEELGGTDVEMPETQAAASASGKEKQLEKEIPWSMIPPDERPEYQKAEATQWEEHLKYGAVRPLSLEESEKVRRPRGGRADSQPTKHFAGDAAGSQPALRGRHWRHSCRLLEWHPSTARPLLRAAQARDTVHALVEILKGVFGLATSPKLWWMKLSSELKDVTLHDGTETVEIIQNEIDPCIFMMVGKDSGEVKGVILTHVDDLLLLCEKRLMKPLQQALSSRFPVEDWQDNSFEYLGCHYDFGDNEVVISQEKYAEARVEPVHLIQGQPDEEDATLEQREENRTAIGSLSWLAKQTRPDLQFGVSQCQRAQNNPKVADLKETNRLVREAKKYKEKGLTLRYIVEPALYGFHDAAWGNVEDPSREADDQDWLGDHKLASQLAHVVLAAGKGAAHGEQSDFSVLEWESEALWKTMENLLFLRSLLASLKGGPRADRRAVEAGIDIHLFTDCKSLYDHLHREGTPKAPADKRLAVDLADLRQTLMKQGTAQWKKHHGEDARHAPERPCRPPIHWVPTEEQLADFLTKKMKAEAWWQTLERGHIRLPLKDRRNSNT
ncbi:unnamed protein product [Symbiodinium sp. CCMP2592]|nr:unnamed protein product [Symbiodinium sp. CCMP2592]